ncbi:MAG TPA: D-2-hydroxyacid dehydrogenase [Rhabdochlamydiaceae bacterium]|jgi:glycerate dehydrogenase
MQAVFLDTKTLGRGVDLDSLKALPLQWTFFDETKPQETAHRIAGAQIVVTNKVMLTKEILEKSPDLKLVCIAATGYNNVDIPAAKARGILICNVPDYSTASVVQLTIAFIFALMTNLYSYVQATKIGEWQKSSQFCLLDYPITELEGKKLGVIGYGNLGKRVAHLMQQMGMQILIAQGRSEAPGRLPLQEVLAHSDVITIHTPLTKETHNLIQRKEFLLMKRSSVLINTARGGIVNEKDLADALREGLIAGAAVDVLSKEPPDADQPLLQKDIPHLLLTPHVGWGSLESRKRLLEVIQSNIHSFLQGNPVNLIN